MASGNNSNKPSNVPRNKWGDPIYIPRSQEWWQIMENEKEAEKQRKEQQRVASHQGRIRRETENARRRLVELDALAEAAPASVENPKIGDFKKNASGQLFRWAVPRRQARPGQRAPAAEWIKVSRQFNYEPDVQVWINRTRRIGTNYQRQRKGRKSRKQRRS